MVEELEEGKFIELRPGILKKVETDEIVIACECPDCGEVAFVILSQVEWGEVLRLAQS